MSIDLRWQVPWFYDIVRGAYPDAEWQISASDHGCWIRCKRCGAVAEREVTAEDVSASRSRAWSENDFGDPAKRLVYEAIESAYRAVAPLPRVGFKFYGHRRWLRRCGHDGAR